MECVVFNSIYIKQQSQSFPVELWFRLISWNVGLINIIISRMMCYLKKKIKNDMNFSKRYAKHSQSIMHTRTRKVNLRAHNLLECLKYKSKR